MAHRVTLIPGDGTGPELCEATRRVLDMVASIRDERAPARAVRGLA